MNVHSRQHTRAWGRASRRSGPARPARVPTQSGSKSAVTPGDFACRSTIKTEARLARRQAVRASARDCACHGGVGGTAAIDVTKVKAITAPLRPPPLVCSCRPANPRCRPCRSGPSASCPTACCSGPAPISCACREPRRAFDRPRLSSLRCTFVNAPAGRVFPVRRAQIRMVGDRARTPDRADGPARLALCFHRAQSLTVQKCSQLKKRIGQPHQQSELFLVSDRAPLHRKLGPSPTRDPPCGWPWRALAAVDHQARLRAADAVGKKFRRAAGSSVRRQAGLLRLKLLNSVPACRCGFFTAHPSGMTGGPLRSKVSAFIQT